jgi:pimeloyl-ACP methyl ester carboxylesterase
MARTAGFSTSAQPGWAEYGDPFGIPLLYHHGMPGAHPEGALLDLEARIHGFRLIVPDRPGIGLTPYRPVLALTDLVQSCCALLDHLEIDACHQVGWSSGGPVALAMAARAPERVRGVTLMASYTHFREVPGLETLLARTPQPTRFMDGKVPGSLNWLVSVMHWTGRLFPWVYLQALRRLCVTVDRELLAQPRVRKLFMAAQKMTFRQGMAGAHQDLMLQYRDWGFRLAEVQAPVLLFQGLEDPFVVPVNGDDLASRLPRCELRYLDEEGHLFPLRREFQNRWLRELRQRLFSDTAMVA